MLRSHIIRCWGCSFSFGFLPLLGNTPRKWIPVQAAETVTIFDHVMAAGRWTVFCFVFGFFGGTPPPPAPPTPNVSSSPKSSRPPVGPGRRASATSSPRRDAPAWRCSLSAGAGTPAAPALRGRRPPARPAQSRPPPRPPRGHTGSVLCDRCLRTRGGDASPPPGVGAASRACRARRRPAARGSTREREKEMRRDADTGEGGRVV